MTIIYFNLLIARFFIAYDVIVLTRDMHEIGMYHRNSEIYVRRASKKLAEIIFVLG